MFCDICTFYLNTIRTYHSNMTLSRILLATCTAVLLTVMSCGGPQDTTTTELDRTKRYNLGLVGFYNVENLFDLEKDPVKRDGDFTPSGRNAWTQDRYDKKLDNIARVISEMGTDISPDGMAVLGLCEVENRAVLKDLVTHSKIADRNYSIVHYESPDERGIDVALLYQPKYFTVTNSRAIGQVMFRDNGSRDYTRDVLLVSGDFKGEPLHVLVNHWPSRGGGEARSRPGRNQAAQINRQIIDSLQAADPEAQVIVMGDLNDDPTNESVTSFLRAKGDRGQVGKDDLYNPMHAYYVQGIGTGAYRDAWNLFDQLIVSQPLLEQEGWFFQTARIFRPKYLFQQSGRYKGYPFRTFAGGQFLGGYSDHLPVYMVLAKEAE